MINQIRVLIKLSNEDFKRQFTGSLLGSSWAFIQPIVITSIYCAVFEFGLKAKGVSDTPFTLWLVAGITPFFTSQML